MRMNHFWAKITKLPQIIFFLKKNINIISMSLFDSFIVQHYCAILTADPDLWGRAILGLKWPIFTKHDFFGKPINIMSMNILAPFIVQNFKKILRVDPELWRCAIFLPKIAIFRPKMFHFLEWKCFGKNH